MIRAADRPFAPLGRRALPVVGAGQVGPYTLFSCRDDTGPAPLAGQFYMIAAVTGWGGEDDERPYLPRALSVARSTPGEGGVRLDFLVEPVGPGTARLARLGGGESVHVTGPFGNGFTVGPGITPLLVGGGIGAAPLLALSDALAAATSRAPRVLLGFRDRPHAAAAELFGAVVGDGGTGAAEAAAAPPAGLGGGSGAGHDGGVKSGLAVGPGVEIATDDGSAGRRGFVTALLDDALDAGGDHTVFACGPPAMLEAVRESCASRGVDAQLALESGMACGFGACFGCVVPTRDGYVRLCVDGPVLAASALDVVVAANETPQAAGYA